MQSFSLLIGSRASVQCWPFCGDILCAGGERDMPVSAYDGNSNRHHKWNTKEKQ